MLRYELREFLHEYTVVDAYTGELAQLDGNWLEGLSFAEASDAIEELCFREAEELSQPFVSGAFSNPKLARAA